MATRKNQMRFDVGDTVRLKSTGEYGEVVEVAEEFNLYVIDLDGVRGTVSEEDLY